ncbi:hypothetical protein NDU88_002044 [Pleurodeles waltl]|uniref:Uncharacterized protein n=1 Tax=Pleurodeles waltl TaxID=8319 RepID=A0AAV7NKX2_PLEWA|nr:hypothetical protein NDU88_002044 [Pleurodeles waltl]
MYRPCILGLVSHFTQNPLYIGDKGVSPRACLPAPVPAPVPLQPHHTASWSTTACSLRWGRRPRPPRLCSCSRPQVNAHLLPRCHQLVIPALLALGAWRRTTHCFSLPLRLHAGAVRSHRHSSTYLLPPATDLCSADFWSLEALHPPLFVAPAAGLFGSGCPSNEGPRLPGTSRKLPAMRPSTWQLFARYCVFLFPVAACM